MTSNAKRLKIAPAIVRFYSVSMMDVQCALVFIQPAAAFFACPIYRSSIGRRDLGKVVGILIMKRLACIVLRSGMEGRLLILFKKLFKVELGVNSIAGLMVAIPAIVQLK